MVSFHQVPPTKTLCTPLPAHLFLLDFITRTILGSIAVIRIGRPSVRQEGDVTADLGKIKIQNWCKMAVDREAWERTAERAETNEEL